MCEYGEFNGIAEDLWKATQVRKLWYTDTDCRPAAYGD